MQQGEAYDFTAAPLHRFPAYDAIHGPVPAFDQHVWLYGFDELRGRILVEPDHEIHVFQMRQHKGPHRIRIDGPVVALAQPFDRFVAVQPKHQHIALRLAAFQQIHMPRMQNVVASVGEDDLFAFPAQGIQFFQQFGQFDHAGMFQHIHCSSLCRRERRFPEAAALSVPRDVFRFSQSRIACSGRNVS